MPNTIYPPIRTFHARHGRLSTAHRHALEHLVPQRDIANLPAPVSLKQLLPDRQVVIDFGCGSGSHAQDLAERGYGVLAIDVHVPGVVALATSGNSDIWVHLGDGVGLITDHLETHSVDEVHVLFPDPWPKARHHKRRLIQPEFLTHVRRILVPSGLLAVVTDDAAYAEHVSLTLPRVPGWHTTQESFTWNPTRYHQRADRLGNQVRVFTARTLP